MRDRDLLNTDLRVLVVSSTARDLALTSQILKGAGIESEGCMNVDHLCLEMNNGVGAVLIVEEALANEGETPLSRYMADQDFWSDIPLVVLARPGADSTRVAAAIDTLGNVTVLERPIRIAALVSGVRSALRARARQYQVRDNAKALEASRAELEMRVQERTGELRESNEKLEQKIVETEAAEARAHQLLRELVSAQETERARIARDLHDELGQQLTSLRLHLSQIGRNLSKSSKARPVLSVTELEAEKIDSRVSFLAWMIRPTTIDELGLAKALRGYVREWSRNFDIAADFTAHRPARARLLPEIEINLYRVAQECLNNVAKYAHAAAVSVLLTINEREACLIVEDDGVGFDTSHAQQQGSDGGLGIRGMQERANLLGGTFEIESAPKAGTTVYVRVPAKFRSGRDRSADGNGNKRL